VIYIYRGEREGVQFERFEERKKERKKERVARKSTGKSLIYHENSLQLLLCNSQNYVLYHSRR
jgi:hypothetical protein